jgi:signal transduction histidine kinase
MITIDNWFIKYAFRPVAILAICLYLFFVTSLLFLYFNQNEDNKLFLHQAAKQLSLAITQKNRPQIDVIISTLSKLETVQAVSLCDNERIVITRRGGEGFCTQFQNSTFDILINGSETLFLRVIFKNIFLTFNFVFGIIVLFSGAFAGVVILFNFKKRFDVDLLEKLKNINGSSHHFSIKELNDISMSLIEFQENKIKLLSQKNLTNLSIQVSHDIRSPLAALNFMINDQEKIAIEDKVFMNKALGRINEIANDLLSENKLVNKNEPIEVVDKVDIVQLISDVVKEKSFELKKYELVTIDFNNNVKLKVTRLLSKKSLSRVLSNLINNSVEAMLYKGHVKISTYLIGCELIIEIIDEGGGLPLEILKNLGKENLTTKVNGNGLGLAHAIKTIEECGGKILLQNFNQGLKISIVLKVELENNVDAILVDNDELCRLMWERKAKAKGLKLLTFASSTTFLEFKKDITFSTPIYLDSQLENDVRGEDIASILYNDGYSKLFMTTGYSAENFADYSFLSGVISKTPPF